MFGSYGRGTAAFGSDLDLVLVDELADLTLSCDALVLTPVELEQRLNDGSRMAAELKRDLRWLL